MCVFEAPDDETAATVLLVGEHAGQRRSQTMRAFTAPDREDSVKGVLTNNARTHGQLRDFLSGVRSFDLQGPSARRSGAAPGGAFVTPLKIESALTGLP